MGGAVGRLPQVLDLRRLAAPSARPRRRAGAGRRRSGPASGFTGGGSCASSSPWTSTFAYSALTRKSESASWISSSASSSVLVSTQVSVSSSWRLAQIANTESSASSAAITTRTIGSARRLFPVPSPASLIAPTLSRHTDAARFAAVRNVVRSPDACPLLRLRGAARADAGVSTVVRAYSASTTSRSRSATSMRRSSSTARCSSSSSAAGSRGWRSSTWATSSSPSPRAARSRRRRPPLRPRRRRQGGRAGGARGGRRRDRPRPRARLPRSVGQPGAGGRLPRDPVHEDRRRCSRGWGSRARRPTRRSPSCARRGSALGASRRPPG